MATHKSYARLGSFVVIGVVVMIATGLFFAQRMRSRDVIPMVTYVTENVSGLDISSPVKYRGVPVGRVTDLRVDPSGSTIEIDFEVFHDRLVTIGANPVRIRALADLGIFPKLRTRIVNNPVTGEGYLLLDIPKDPPPAAPLGFTPTRPHVPSMPSPLAVAQDRLPVVLERTEQTLQTLREIISRIPEALDRSDRFFTNVERIVRESELPELSADSRTFFKTTTEQIGHMTSELNRLIGEDGTLVKFAEEARAAIKDADVARSSQAARGAADRSSMAADDLRRALPAIRDALEQLRETARRLEEQPESVVYGPRKSGETPR